MCKPFNRGQGVVIQRTFCSIIVCCFLPILWISLCYVIFVIVYHCRSKIHRSYGRPSNPAHTVKICNCLSLSKLEGKATAQVWKESNKKGNTLNVCSTNGIASGMFFKNSTLLLVKLLTTCRSWVMGTLWLQYTTCNGKSNYVLVECVTRLLHTWVHHRKDEHISCTLLSCRVIHCIKTLSEGVIEMLFSSGISKSDFL